MLRNAQISAATRAIATAIQKTVTTIPTTNPTASLMMNKATMIRTAIARNRLSSEGEEASSMLKGYSPVDDVLRARARGEEDAPEEHRCARVGLPHRPRRRAQPPPLSSRLLGRCQEAPAAVL